MQAQIILKQACKHVLLPGEFPLAFSQGLFIACALSPSLTKPFSESTLQSCYNWPQKPNGSMAMLGVWAHEGREGDKTSMESLSRMWKPRMLGSLGYRKVNSLLSGSLLPHPLGAINALSANEIIDFTV